MSVLKSLKDLLTPLPEIPDDPAQQAQLQQQAQNLQAQLNTQASNVPSGYTAYGIANQSYAGSYTGIGVGSPHQHQFANTFTSQWTNTVQWTQPYLGAPGWLSPSYYVCIGFDWDYCLKQAMDLHEELMRDLLRRSR